MQAERKQYKFIMMLSMFYAVLLLTCSSLTHKFILIGAHQVSAGSFLMPFWFLVSDVITEVYGYKMSRRLLWNLIIVDLFIYAIFQTFALIQPNTTNGQAYFEVFGSMFRTYLAVWIALFFANFFNTYIIARLKITFHSKYFWLRSLAASAIGEIMYTSIGFFLILAGTVSMNTLFWMIVWGCILKITVTAIAAGPASFITYFLKKAEDVDIYDTNINFNPFKFQL